MAGNDPEFGTAGGCAKIHGRVMLRRMLVTDELASDDMGSSGHRCEPRPPCPTLNGYARSVMGAESDARSSLCLYAVVAATCKTAGRTTQDPRS